MSVDLATSGASRPRPLVIIPCHDDGATLGAVIQWARDEVEADFLVVDDGSEDDTSAVARAHGAHVLRESTCQGYGGALTAGFAWASQQGYLACATMDADGQHDPSVLPAMLSALSRADIVSGSRYHPQSTVRGVEAPVPRRALNLELVQLLNERFGWNLTDAFCGLKAYRTSALRRLRLSERGYGFPLQVWVQIAALGLVVEEAPVPRIYLDASRTFGGGLDDSAVRRQHYLQLMERELGRWGLEALQLHSSAPGVDRQPRLV